MGSIRYFSDNFFSAGVTDIYNEEKEIVGQLDLKSAFSSSLVVRNNSGETLVQGRFPFLSNKWIVEDAGGSEKGILRARFSFFSKRYEYLSNEHGLFRIESEAFSRHYELYNEQKEKAAEFDKINGFLASPAFRLQNQSPMEDEELIAVVMGVSNIQKRRSNSANAAAGT